MESVSSYIFVELLSRDITYPAANVNEVV